MKYPISDIIDRLSILKLKTERTDEENAIKEFRALWAELMERVGFDIFGLVEKQHHLSPSMRNKIKATKEPFDRLYKINGKIWDLEADIRGGKDGKLGLGEVGRRALAIRDLNKLRVAIKNEITSLAGEGFREVKINHASE